MGTAERMLDTTEPRPKHQIPSKTMLFAAIAAVVLGGPLLVLMTFTLFATIALFIVSAPLLLLFSPLLLGAGFVFVAALVGFGVAAVTAMAGLAAFGWVLQSIRGDAGRERETAVESVGRVKDAGNSWANHLKVEEAYGAKHAGK